MANRFVADRHIIIIMKFKIHQVVTKSFKRPTICPSQGRILRNVTEKSMVFGFNKLNLKKTYPWTNWTICYFI